MCKRGCNWIERGCLSQSAVRRVGEEVSREKLIRETGQTTRKKNKYAAPIDSAGKETKSNSMEHGTGKGWLRGNLVEERGRRKGWLADGRARRQ